MSAQQLRRLQQATAILARAIDADEIARELGRGAADIAAADGVFVVRVDLEKGDAVLVYTSDLVRDAETRRLPLGDGAIARVARSGEHWSATGADAAVAAAADAGIVPADAVVGSLLVLPIMHDRRLFAVVGLYAEQGDAFDAPAIDAVRTLGTQAGTALSNAQLFAESERERRQTQALADAARAASESLKMGEVVRLILRHASGLLHGEGACLALREGNYLHIVAGVGVAELLAGVHLPLAGSLAGRVVRESITLISNDLRNEPESHRPALQFANVSRLVAVPMLTSRGVLGVLMVLNRPDDFVTEDARVLQRLADQVAVAIVNARLFEEVTEASRAWTATFDAIGVGLVIVDDAGNVVRYNARARQMAGAGAGGPRRAPADLPSEPDLPMELAGRSFYEAVLGVTRPNDDPVARTLADGSPARSVIDSPRAGRVVMTVAAHLDRGAIITLEEAPDSGATGAEHGKDVSVGLPAE